MQENTDIKYCVTSFTDLLGFSSHLEIGNDLRTKIGQEVINRLNFLESAIEQFLKEKKKYTKYYPSNIKYKRINDSLILTMDLPEFLTPRIGEISKEGVTANEIRRFFPNQDFETIENFECAYREKITFSILELTQFIGLVSRIHSFINRKENESFFPGAKTVIASGYRKSFITNTNEEDYFSANFSFSNAYIAESLLKGQRLFIDNNILRLLGLNQHTKNVLKIASFINEQTSFDPFDDKEVSLDSVNKLRKGEVQEISIFRKKYLFRELNPQPLSFLQLFPTFLPFLKGEKKMKILKNKKKLFRHIYNYFLNEIKTDEILDQTKHFFFFRFDIEDNIESVKQLILTEESSIINKENKNSFNKMYYRFTETLHTTKG